MSINVLLILCMSRLQDISISDSIFLFFFLLMTSNFDGLYEDLKLHRIFSLRNHYIVHLTLT